MGVPKTRGENAARRFLAEFREFAKSQSLVARAFVRHGSQGADVAPLEASVPN